MLKSADHGDNNAVDMLVGDIYGRDYGEMGFTAKSIASTFGKAFKQKSSELCHPTERFSKEDMSRSLLNAICYNIAQLSYLHAKLHNLTDIYFGGSFIQGHEMTMNTLSSAIKYWSSGTKTPFFMRHEGYLGAMGAFLRGQSSNSDKSLQS